LLKLSKYYYVDIPNELGNVVQSRTIDSFSDCDCFRIFRFRKNHLVELFKLLNIPRRIGILNGSVLSGEEVFLFGINRLTCCNTIEDLVKVYGRDNSQWVRSFHWFIEFILVNWKHLLTNMLPFWKNSFQTYCNKIRGKLKTFNYVYDESFRIFGFIDCTVIKIQRPGGGPNVDGSRKSRRIQQAFYNGWKHQHGIKFQTIEGINGLCLHLYGPRSFRRCDLRLLGDSRINQLLADLQPNEPPDVQKSVSVW
jgi:hypothetical protein